MYLILRSRNPAAYNQLHTIYSTLQRDRASFWPAMATLRGLYLRDRPVSPGECAAIQRAVPGASFVTLYLAIRKMHCRFALGTSPARLQRRAALTIRSTPLHALS